ncbi:MAG: hypothetical protein RMJ55_19825 [Roseiflexaceae bacterium]|nr:hypothetical protein [Roseiflexaceae bacterium]
MRNERRCYIASPERFNHEQLSEFRTHRIVTEPWYQTQACEADSLIAVVCDQRGFDAAAPGKLLRYCAPAMSARD